MILSGVKIHPWVTSAWQKLGAQKTIHNPGTRRALSLVGSLKFTSFKLDVSGEGDSVPHVEDWNLLLHQGRYHHPNLTNEKRLWKYTVILLFKDGPLFYLFSFKEYNWFTTLLLSAIQQCGSAICIHTSPPSWASPPPRYPTPLDHHRALSWAPCAVQQLPIGYLFDTW